MRRSPYLKIRRRGAKRLDINRFSNSLLSALDESAVDFKYSSDCANFRVNRGVLTDGWGVEEDPAFAGAENVLSAWIYKRSTDGSAEEIPMYCDTDGHVHAVKDGVDETVRGMTFSCAPYAVNYRLRGEDVSLICSEDDGMAVYDGAELEKIENSPRIKSMALHYERLFVTTADEPDTVRFSDDLDPTNWAEGLDSGGFVKLVDGYGNSNKVVAFLNYVYIFRDYGISRMIAYADQSEFSVSNLYVSAGRIYSDSVALCGDRVIFLASDGLYVFDGVSTSRLLEDLGALTEYKDTAVGAYFDGKYCLAYSSAGGVNDSLLVYDISAKTHEISRGFGITSFVAGKYLSAVVNGVAAKITPCGSALGTPLSKKWRVPFNALSTPDKVKRIAYFTVETATPLDVKLLCDGREKTFCLKGKSGVQRVKAGLSGTKIGAEISTDSTGTRIAELAFVVENK